MNSRDMHNIVATHIHTMHTFQPNQTEVRLNCLKNQ